MILRPSLLILAVLSLAACKPNDGGMPHVSNTRPEPISVEAKAPVSQAPQTVVRHWDAPPPMSIDANKAYSALVTMKKGGHFTLELFPKEAPLAVNNFVFLARQGFYNGLVFHRVIHGFMAQGGDPTGSGMGGPGYAFKNEPNHLRFDRAGLLAMANAGPDTNGSQFFITYGPTPHLDGGFSLFGRVSEGMDVVNSITSRDPDNSPEFAGDVIERVEILEK